MIRAKTFTVSAMGHRFMMRGKIVLVPFPFDDLSLTKVRPAVALTEPIGPFRHVIIAFLSSQVPSELLDTDLLIKTSDPDFGDTGLRVDSVVRVHRLTTVTTSLFQRELGMLSPRLQYAMEARVRKLFALS